MASEAQAPATVLKQIEAALRQCGVDPDVLAQPGGPDQVRCIVVAPSLKGCVEEVASSTRGHVIMVRVDEPTAKSLDRWVETGALRSRSEAAAVFMKIGLRVHDDRLERVSDALRDVERSKQVLAERMKEVLGEDQTA